MSESNLSNTTSPPPITVTDESCRSLVGHSAAWKEAIRLGEIVARQQCATLILGEVGTGKRSLAHFIHQRSRLADRCCWVLRGGTDDEKALTRILRGISSCTVPPPWEGPTNFFEIDDVGTLLIEDADLLSANAQSLLLEILILLEFADYQSAPPLRQWPLVVATSRRDLRQAVINGHFREDLFWRLSIFLIELAPLRRRSDDIEPLLQHFLSVFGEMYSRDELAIDPSTREVLVQYSWPGNIIELRNYLLRAVAGNDHNLLSLSMFPASVSGDLIAAQRAVFRPTDQQSLIREFVNSHLGKSEEQTNDLHKQIVEPVEKELIHQVMDLCNQTQTKAATRLGINRNTLYKKLIEYGLNKATEKLDSGD